MDAEAWPFEISMAAVQLFEALPKTFSFEELLDVGSGQGITSETTVTYLREWQEWEMIAVDAERFTKTGEKPYF